MTPPTNWQKQKQDHSDSNAQARRTHLAFVNIQRLDVCEQRRNAPTQVSFHITSQTSRELVPCDEWIDSQRTSTPHPVGKPNGLHVLLTVNEIQDHALCRVRLRVLLHHLVVQLHQRVRVSRRPLCRCERRHKLRVRHQMIPQEPLQAHVIDTCAKRKARGRGREWRRYSRFSTTLQCAHCSPVWYS